MAESMPAFAKGLVGEVLVVDVALVAELRLHLALQVLPEGMRKGGVPGE